MAQEVFGKVDAKHKCMGVLQQVSRHGKEVARATSQASFQIYNEPPKHSSVWNLIMSFSIGRGYRTDPSLQRHAMLCYYAHAGSNPILRKAVHA